MTAFYIFRVVFLVFGGQYRGSHGPHESSKTMLIPMALLAIPAVASGWLNANGGFERLLNGGATHGFWQGVVGVLGRPLTWVSLLAAGAGILAAYAMYIKVWISPNRIKWIFRSLYAIFTRKYGMDELYEHLIAGNLLYRGLFQAFQWLDKNVIDGAANGITFVTTGAGRTMRRIQTGQLQLYGIISILGIIIIALVALVRG
jgi:NADH-quinone oxidoreductase subunit L